MQIHGSASLNLWVAGASVNGKVQLANGEDVPTCSWVRAIGGQALYDASMKCKDYCGWRKGDGNVW